jgi:hypothetical protein
MVSRVLLGLFVTVALNGVGPVVGLAAQPASPTSAQSGPTCGVTPQPVEALIALAFPQGTPAALSVTSFASVAESDLPLGAPADAGTAAAAEHVVQTWLVCMLAGEDARLFALMTDALDAVYLQQYISHPVGDSPQELRALLEVDLTGSIVVGSSSALSSPGRDIRMLDDGRVGGIWAVEGDHAFIILAQEDETWLVDEIIDIAE